MSSHPGDLNFVLGDSTHPSKIMYCYLLFDICTNYCICTKILIATKRNTIPDPASKYSSIRDVHGLNHSFNFVNFTNWKPNIKRVTSQKG